MARPTINFEVKKPSMKSPGAGMENIHCGADWNIQTEIRSPYKGVDRFVNTLPVIFGDMAALTFMSEGYENVAPNLNTSIPILVGNSFREKLAEAIQGARELLDNYDDEGYIDSKNRSAIKAMIDKASKYLAKANEFRLYWKDDYNSDPGKGPLGWPLEIEKALHGCEFKQAPDKGEFYTMTKDGAKTVSFACPTEQEKSQHEDDRFRYFRLMEAALFNCRCAQEAAAAVGTYFRNKEYFDSRAGAGTTVKYVPPTKEARIKFERATVIPEVELEGELPPMIPEDPEEEVAPAPAKKKKKGNTILLAAAAGLGLMMIRK